MRIFIIIFGVRITAESRSLTVQAHHTWWLYVEHIFIFLLLENKRNEPN